MLNRTAFGTRIRAEREKRNLSRAGLAEKLGVSDKYLYEVERGGRGMSLEKLVSLCELFDVTADYLLFGAEKSDAENSLMGMINRCDRKKLPYLERIVKSFLDAYYDYGE